MGISGTRRLRFAGTAWAFMYSVLLNIFFCCIVKYELIHHVIMTRLQLGGHPQQQQRMRPTNKMERKKNGKKITGQKPGPKRKAWLRPSRAAVQVIFM